MGSLSALALPGVVSASAIALPLLTNRLLRGWRWRRALPLARRVFRLLDPLLNTHLSRYRGSDVQFAAELLTGVLADGKLSRAEVHFVAAEVLRRWSPAEAAGRLPAMLLPASREKRVYSAVERLVERGDFSLASLPEAVQSIRLSLS